MGFTDVHHLSSLERRLDTKINNKRMLFKRTISRTNERYAAGMKDQNK